MSKLETGLLVTGAVALFFAVVAAVLGAGSAGGTGTRAVIVIVGLYGALVLLYLLFSGRKTDDAGASWTEVGPLTEHAPERTPSTYPLVGTTNLDVEGACRRARNERDIEAGLQVVRPVLRQYLVDGLVAGGHDRERAETVVRDGSWTDDAVARAVLSEEREPDLSAREQLREWLFPGKVVRSWTRQSVARIAEAVEDSVPTVVGQQAPRRIPVRPPTLEEQRRSATGDIEPAADSSFGYRWESVTSGADEQAERNPPSSDGTEGDDERSQGEQQARTETTGREASS